MKSSSTKTLANISNILTPANSLDENQYRYQPHQVTPIESDTVESYHYDEKMILPEISSSSFTPSTIVSPKGLKQITMVTEDDQFEAQFLKSCGYIKIKHIADTLQGSIFTAIKYTACSSKLVTSNVVIKRASKVLHENNITIQDGQIIKVKEDMIKEKNILKYFTEKKNCPLSIIKYIDFIETYNNFYFIMEDGGKSLFDFVIKAHSLIQNGTLKLSVWRKMVKFIMYQMIIAVKWLHTEMNCAHLDISLENFTIQNGDFILGADGFYTVNPKLVVKVCDFGLAEFFDADSQFICDKYVGKTQYKSPEIYEQKEKFDARSADIWSLGICLFCLAVGCPPYYKPNDNDVSYKHYVKKRLFKELLHHWSKGHYITVKLLDLIKGMINVDANKRFSIRDICEHPWLKIYYVNCTYLQNW